MGHDECHGGPSTFADVTNNGPQGNINPNQFPVSGVAARFVGCNRAHGLCNSDGLHGRRRSRLEDHKRRRFLEPISPRTFPTRQSMRWLSFLRLATVYVATDVGVFGSSIFAPNWTEVGPNPGPTVWILAQRRRHCAGSVRFRRTAIVAGVHLWPRHLAVQSCELA